MPGRAPVRAHTLASRHARRYPGHEACVIDLEELEVEHRYRFDALTALDIGGEEAPF